MGKTSSGLNSFRGKSVRVLRFETSRSEVISICCHFLISNCHCAFYDPPTVKILAFVRALHRRNFNFSIANRSLSPLLFEKWGSVTNSIVKVFHDIMMTTTEALITGRVQNFVMNNMETVPPLIEPARTFFVLLLRIQGYFYMTNFWEVIQKNKITMRCPLFLIKTENIQTQAASNSNSFQE